MQTWKQSFDIALTFGVVIVAALSIWMIIPKQAELRDNAQTFLVEDWQAYNRQGIRLGSSSAVLEISAFLDLTCPYSRTPIPVLDSLRNLYAEEIAVIWIHFPLSGRERSREITIGAECAREQNMFQDAVTFILATDEEEFPNLPAALVDLMPDHAAFAQCINRAPSRFELVARHRHIALTTGARGTPHVWVNGRVFGGRSVEEFTDALVANR